MLFFSAQIRGAGGVPHVQRRLKSPRRRSGRTPAGHFRDVEDAVPYGFAGILVLYRRGDSCFFARAVQAANLPGLGHRGQSLIRGGARRSPLRLGRISLEGQGEFSCSFLLTIVVLP